MPSLVYGPNYSVKFYRDGLYKLVRFHRSLVPHLPDDSSVVGRDREDKASDEKFLSALSRARSVVLQIALCNEWDYFFTGTLDAAKWDRHSLDTFYAAFSQWIRDQRKKYSCKIQYCFIPELHKDGAWHIHGFLRGLPESQLMPFVRGVHPLKLVEHGFLNWPGYERKFGFCSLGRIRDGIGAAFYVTKYITKDVCGSSFELGSHIYRASIGLNRAVSLGYVFGRYADLDSRISHVGEFCDTAWIDDVSWSFWLPFLPDPDELEPIDYPEDTPVIFTNLEDSELQLSLFDFYPDFAG